MQTHIVLLLILSFIGGIKPQNCFGTYKPSTSCPTNVCCCLSAQVVITYVTANTMSVSTGLSGSGLNCFGLNSYQTNIATPTGYFTTVNMMLVTANFTLSSNSLVINIINSYNALCGTTLTKNLG
jgi:hypothetical protein